jgi:molybdenum cofactor cytidylyltransferase
VAEPPIVGLILAAGQSTRMGRPKALLPCPPEGETFVARAIGALREGGLSQIAVVGRPSDEPLHAEVRRIDSSIRYLVNPAPEQGQLSSLLVGVEYAAGLSAAGVLVLPVDIPLVRPETVAILRRAFLEGSDPIVRPVHRGRHGHPVIFRASVFGELRSADVAVGAKAVLHAHAGAVLDVDVGDAGIVRDVDVAQDYRDLFNADPA